jgi:hypothetical protein
MLKRNGIDKSRIPKKKEGKRRYHRIDVDESYIVIVYAKLVFRRVIEDNNTIEIKPIPFTKIIHRSEISSIKRFLKDETGCDDVDLLYEDQVL